MLGVVHMPWSDQSNSSLNQCSAIDAIVGFLQINFNFHKVLLSFFDMHVMHDFLHYNNIIHTMSSRHKTTLRGIDEKTHVLQSVHNSFRDRFIYIALHKAIERKCFKVSGYSISGIRHRWVSLTKIIIFGLEKTCPRKIIHEISYYLPLTLKNKAWRPSGPDALRGPMAKTTFLISSLVKPWPNWVNYFMRQRRQ